jgi:uncharacterized protein (TIGR02996 family)
VPSTKTPTKTPVVATAPSELDELLRSEPRAAIRPLLHLWQTTFDPDVGRVLELVGASVAEPLAELPVKKTERATRLVELARTTGPEDRSAVLAAFEAFAREASPATLRPAIEVWLEVTPDPRVARAAMRILDGSQEEPSGKVWRRLVGLLERHGDPSVAAGHASYVTRATNAAAGWGFSPERLGNVVKKLEKDRRCRTPVAPDTLARWSKGFAPAPAPASAVTEESLLEAVTDRPDDDAPRLVYADWLIERRDPRGELIALQVARAGGKSSKDAKKREAQLLADCGQAQLGSLGPAIVRTELVWSRGFAAKIRAKGMIPACPATRLLEEVQFAGFYAVADFETGARFDCVRRAIGPFNRESCLAFPALAPRLVDWETSLVPAPGEAERSVARDLAVLLEAARDLRLERFVTGAATPAAGDVLRTMLGHEVLRHAATLGLRTQQGVWTLSRSSLGLEVVLERGLSPTGFHDREATTDTLKALDRGSVARLTVRTPEPRDEAERLLTKLRATQVAVECELVPIAAQSTGWRRGDRLR